MQRAAILAHRGLFVTESEMNSLEALHRAIDQGFGIETDLRDLNGEVVISHDPPKENPHPPKLELLLEHVNLSPYSSRIALNIKSDGLSNLIDSKIKSLGVNKHQFFVFDMSIPDSLGYLKRSIPVYTRISDYEQVAAFPEMASGVWVDNFGGSFPQVERALELIAKGTRVTIVSPELHHRDHVSLWNDIVESGIYLSPLFELCTDYPTEAAHRFLGA